VKMTKNQVCYKKTCWSTKNTVIEEAQQREEEHFKEELDRRIEPHSHKKNHAVYNSNEDEINKSIMKVKYKKDETDIYKIKDKKAATYDFNVTYLKTDPSSEEKSDNNLNLSKNQGAGEYEEFLIEQDPRGGLKVSNFYKTTAGEFRKKGLIPIYDVFRFNRY